MPTSEPSFSPASEIVPGVPASSRSVPPASPRPRSTAGRPRAPKTSGHSRANGQSNGRAASPTIPRTTTDAADVRAEIARLRDEACERARPAVKGGAAPIRVMARMVRELEDLCHERAFPQEIVAAEVVNRTIGDVDLRKVSARDDGPEYVTLADEMGLALPGERIDGYTATGARYRQIHTRMRDFERQLLARRWDMRMYDLAGVGNPILREMLSDYAARHWGFTLPPAQIHLSLGALDGLDKFFRGFAMARRQAGIERTAVVFPAPSFNVPEWQAVSLGLRLHRIYTRPEDHFKVTPAQLGAALDDAPDIGAFYLTVSNNPTAFAYSPAELAALFAVLRERASEALIVADLAYVGTGNPAEDRARMAAFDQPGTRERTVFVSSFSKTHTLTGDRCGWVGFGDPALAQTAATAWANSTASLPAEWQLRYMAYLQLFTEHPELEERIRALYQHRRARLVAQLRRLDARQHVFAQVNLDDGGTVYNWSQLRPGADVFSLFSTTGIAGVPGGAFGYSDDFIRLSVGCIPVPSV